jgi:alpha-tubulin suppressor-like RCC1 family protein
MDVQRLVSASVAAAAAVTALAACGASSSHTPVARRRGGRDQPAAAATQPGRSSSVVYEWGQFGGGRPALVAHRAAAGLKVSGSPFGIGPARARPSRVRGIVGQVIQVASSNSDDYALTRDGAVYAWGPGHQGELGNGTRVRLSETAVRVRFPAGVRIAALPNPMPYNAGMAIATDGRVWAWGNDRAREFCQSRSAIITTPVRVPLPHVSLAAGALRHAVYDTAGRIVSCGAGPNGQLGDGTRGPQARSGRPVAVRGLPSGTATALTSGWGNAGVLMADGRYYDWGYNAGGQVGDGTTREATTAVAVALPGPVRSVFEGGSYANNGQTEAILRDGSFWEWGEGDFGQLGDHDRDNALRPVRLTLPGGVRPVAVNSGGSTDYAIDGRAQLFAWGNNQAGQLGDGSHALLRSRPVLDPVAVRQVASTAHNVVALGAPPRTRDA